LVIAKGYRRYANTREMVLDNDGRKTTGYLITNKRNDIIAGADDNELYTMSFDELVDFFENYSG
jgi:general stress protein 26